jgi:hypothetical protein
VIHTQVKSQLAFRELFENVHDIKMKAAQSEAVIGLILNDNINSQYAKSQLLSTSASVNQLVALCTATDELDAEMAKDYTYANIALILKTCNDQFTALQKYTLVPKIDQMKVRVNANKTILRRKIFHAFREIGQIMDGMAAQAEVPDSRISGSSSHGSNQGSSHGSSHGAKLSESDKIIESLTDAHLVVAQLGDEVLVDLLEEIVQLQLLPYEKLGRPGGSLYSLDKDALDRRWSGLRRLVYAAEARMGKICPPQWMLPHRIYIEFAARTANHLRSLLTQQDAKYRQTIDTISQSISIGEKHGLGAAQAAASATESLESQEQVAILVTTLKSCLSIENEMASRFEEASMTVSGGSKEEEEVLAKLSRGNMISEVLDDFMEPYVKLERRNLEETIKNLIIEDTPPPPVVLEHSNSGNAIDKLGKDTKKAMTGITNLVTNKKTSGESGKEAASTAVPIEYGAFPSAGKLFELIRGSMKRIIQLTTGIPFLQLVTEYRMCIQIYAEALKEFCPTGTIPQQTIASNIPGTSTKVLRPKITLEEEALLCRVINTAEYCADVIPKMEEMIKSKISYHFVADVDMTAQVGVFQDVISHSMAILVSGTIEKTEGALRVMRKTNWSTMESVGDESPYVQPMLQVISNIMPRLRDVLPRPCFKHFCTTFMSDFLDTYHTQIMNLRQICPIGAEQLLLDTNSLKNVFSRLHHVGLPPSSSVRTELPIPGPYVKISTLKLRNIEMTLKLLTTEDDQFESMFNILLPEGTVADMQAIKELKYNPGLINSTIEVVGDISGAVKDVGGTTTQALKTVGGATTRAIGGVGGSTTRAIGAGSKKAFDKVKGFTSNSIGKMKGLTSALKGGNNDDDNHMDEEEDEEVAVPAPTPPQPSAHRAMGRYG